jgi:hypothetical protein
MRILLDNGVFSHSEFAQNATKQTSVRWGNTNQVASIHGFIRKAPHKDLEYQRQKEALFTIGRLIREGRIEVYVYIEILFERMRGKGRFPVCDALKGCNIQECPPALDRSKFSQTMDFRELISKGGKKDRKAGVELGTATQIAFLEFLCGLRKKHVHVLTQHAAQIGLTEFEVESLKKVNWFQSLCRRWGSPENYPDIFHLWTSERNGLDAVLTLDKGLTNFVSGVRKEKTKNIEIKTEVLRPLDLLRKLRIDKPDPVPLDSDRFYHFFEVTR